MIQSATDPETQRRLVEGFFSAYFERGQDLGDAHVLAEVGAAAGFADTLRVLEDSSLGAEKVAADIAEAARLGIGGVPFIVMNQKYGISGAQSVESLRSALTSVHEETLAKK